jgi:hypothetical protein
MKVVVLLMLVPFSISCTPLNPIYDLKEPVSYADCETVDCVIDRVNRMEGECVKFDFMQGYKLANLMDMRMTGQLEVRELNPALALTLGVFGLSKPVPAYAGGVQSCTVWYLGHWPLAHELMHCRGCDENPIGFNPLKLPFTDRYTPAQRYYMDLEGVGDWRHTRYYQAEDDWNHE